jgi:hypothetical protein
MSLFEIDFSKLADKLQFAIADITKIEYGLTYAPNGRRSAPYFACFHNDDKAEFPAARTKWRAVTAFAQARGLNKMTFFFPHDAKEKIVYEKTNHQIELILNYPDRDRIVNRNSEPIVLMAIVLPMIIVLPILFFIVSTIKPNANVLKFGLPIWVVLGACLLLILRGCIQGKRLRKKESQTFNAPELSAQLYPYIRLTEQELFYERYGAKHMISWDSVTAMENNPGRTILYTDDNQQFPIPSYDVISIFDNSLLVEKIVEFGGLVEDGSRKNYWIKAGSGV